MKFTCRCCKRPKDELMFTPAEQRRKWGLPRCRECRSKYEKNRHNKRLARNVCVRCGQDNKDNDFRACNSCREKNNKKTKASRETLRLEVFDAYGGAFCQCCGETNKEFLCIDHIGGGGLRHRREIGNNGGAGMYHWLRKNNYPRGFRVLCYNCNQSKGHLGYCPHEKKIDFFNLDKELAIVENERGANA